MKWIVFILALAGVAAVTTAVYLGTWVAAWI